MKTINILTVLILSIIMTSCALHSNSARKPTYFNMGFCDKGTSEKVFELKNPTFVRLTKEYFVAHYENCMVMFFLLDAHKQIIPLEVGDQCLIGEDYVNQVYFKDYNDFSEDTAYTSYFQNPCLTVTKRTKKYVQGEFIFVGPHGMVIRSEFAGRLKKPEKE